MNSLKKFTILLIGFVCLYAFCKKQTDGFSLANIYAALPLEKDWTLDPKISSYLSQPYRYLTKGAQTYVFLSEDGQYVLKFYRQNKASHPLKCIAFLLPFKKRLLQTLNKREQKRQKDFASYQLAYQKLKEETGLLCLHLNATTCLNQSVTLYDKIGVLHRVDLDTHMFFIQKSAKLIYPTLEKWIEKDKMGKAKETLSALLTLLKVRYHKRIFDKDPDLKSNFGFTKRGPIQFDIGRYKEIPITKSCQEELICITDRLCQWLDLKAPQLSAHIREEIKNP